MHSRKTFQCKHDFWIKCKNYFCILCKNDFCIKCKQLLTNKSDQICLLCYFAFRYLSWKVLPLATPSRQCRLYLKHYFLPKMKILNISDFFRDQTLLYTKVYQSQLIVYQRFHWKANVRAHSINGRSLQYPSHSSVRVRTLHFAFFIRGSWRPNTIKRTPLPHHATWQYCASISAMELPHNLWDA